ncbi:MAG: ABC transporter ATP-binding protein [Alphaproteobacteria bacterium]|jgi:lipoprotein-releasing system ATP-binding protein|nr:ABC transporter ATP-binding protein [Alphaproteobacteria bacterium]MDP6814029.1 ABC transporter ATP-binding protein [Alphaproteobacteria bacterium]
MSMLQAEGVSRVLEGEVPVTLVRDIDVTFEAGEFCAITGPSGSGKSSLLYLLGLLDVPTEGRISIEDAATSSLPSDALADVRLGKLGFVFQFHFLLQEFTIRENVALPIRKLGRLAEPTALARAESLLEELGLGDKTRKYPHQLSGGERQRAAVARALANDPLIVLADEPTGNLDRRNGSIVFDIFERLAKEQGRTVITVTHDPSLAARAGRRITLVDGRIQEP